MVWTLEMLGLKVAHVGTGDFRVQAPNGHELFLTREAISQLKSLSDHAIRSPDIVVDDHLR